ncbi:hypothetical protein GCU60_04350 [Blastococcus saxobsidens]|uniref:Uncharacterized protein n=1 Tax=Blastococcus saxobsidens TaxID=138336 RepID=A0A6L9VYZ0_9ACTN|nr:hypothetical protein [Blastococcus saxobsidens]NEK84993.1 hypothetical protein [Blastococcus saxobsidens]
MESYAPEQETYWVVQPLVDAGLRLEEIRDLVGRLGFEAVVSDSRSLDAAASSLVLDQPADVRAAWVETINRMITAPRPAPDAGPPPFRPAPPA